MIRLPWFEKNQDHDLPTYDYVIKEIKNKEGHYIGKLYRYPYYMFADEFGEISFVILDKSKKTVVGLLIVDIIKSGWYQSRLMIINSNYQQKQLGVKLFTSLIKNNKLKLVSDNKQSDGGIKLWKTLYTVPGITVIATDDDSFTKFNEVELIDGKLESTIPLYDTTESKKITDKLEVLNNKIKDIQDYLDNLVSNYTGDKLQDVIQSLSKENKEKIYKLYSIIDELQKEKSSLDNEYNDMSAQREEEPYSESLLIAIPSKDKDFFIENKLYEDGGRIVKGVNTTVDVGVDEIKKQAKKFGNTVNRDGYPPLLNKKATRNTTPNNLFNMGMTSNITESLNTPYSYNWTQKSDNSWTAKSRTDDNREIEARFSLVFKPHNRWSMGFIVDGDDKKTGKGDQFKIFSTIIAIVRDFINEVSPNVLTFTGKTEDDGSSSRLKLYKAFAKTLTNNTEYKTEKFSIGKETSNPSIVIKIIKNDFDDEFGLKEKYTSYEVAIMEGGHTLDEDWKDKLRKAAMIGSVGAIGAGAFATKQEYDKYTASKNEPVSSYSQPKKMVGQPIKPVAKITAQPKKKEMPQEPTKQADTRPMPTPDIQPGDTDTTPTVRPPRRPSALSITDNPLENYIISYATKNGITGNELISFMAQIAHETKNFKRMEEEGANSYFRKYEKAYNPKTADILGNTEKGDGKLFKGRGYVQLTGRYNYTLASEELGLDLVDNPDLAEEPENAAKIAVWYWNYRVAKNTKDFDDVKKVTMLINGGINGLSDRIEKYNTYSNRKKIMKTEDVITENSIRLKDLATIKTNYEDADFWVWRKNSIDKVGTPTKEYNPNHIGIKVTRTDVLMPEYLFYMMQYLHGQGYFKSRAVGATNLVNIKADDVKNITMSLNESNKKRIIETIKKIKESEIVDLNKRREDEKLKSFHKDLMTQVKSGASAMAVAYNIAKEQGLFDDLPVGTRFTLPKGASYIVTGHGMSGSKTDQLQKHQLEFRSRFNFGSPMFIKSEDRYYRPMINAEQVAGGDTGSTMSFELDKLVNFDTGEKRYTKFTGPRLAEEEKVDQVKGKEPLPKKSKPSNKGFQDHPYRSRLVGETILDATPLLVSFYENIIKNEKLVENKIDNTELKKFIVSYNTNPKLGNNYFYCSFVLHDFFPMINVAYTKNSYQLLNIEESSYIFDINDKNIKFPQYKDVGDAAIISLLFYNDQDLNNFMADLHLQFSDYRISKSIIDKNSLTENISITGTERAKLAKKKGLEPGTDEWFAHWFSLPYMIDQKKKNHKRGMGVKPTIF